MDFELDEKRAKDCYEQLLRFLDFSARSEKELIDKLYKKGYHKNEVEFAIGKAKSHNFINDEEYAKSYILSNKNKTGKMKLSYKLVNILGVSELIVEDILDQLYPYEEEISVCKAFALKYISIQEKSNKDYSNKLAPHLYSKGFSYSIINKVISSLSIENQHYDDI